MNSVAPIQALVNPRGRVSGLIDTRSEPDPASSLAESDTQYEWYMEQLLRNGTKKADRTGTGTTSIFGYQMRFDLQAGFPLITTKKVHMRSIIEELLWFLSGSSDNNLLQERNVSIWNEWAKPDGDLGPVYGVQWRKWLGKPFNTYCKTLEEFNLGNKDYPDERSIKPLCWDAEGFMWAQAEHDQISDAIKLLKTNPDSRRIIVSAWNVADLEAMALMPCHAFFQFYTTLLSLDDRLKLAGIPEHAYRGHLDAIPDSDMHIHLDELEIPRRKLDCQLYQRSVDSFLGLPFNLASYALLTHMVAQQCGMLAGDFVWTGGDCHIYDNHLQQVDTQLRRTAYPFPTLSIKRKPASIFDYKLEDFEIVGYKHHPAIKGQVSK